MISDSEDPRDDPGRAGESSSPSAPPSDTAVAFVDHIPCGVVGADLSGTVVAVNRAAIGLLGDGPAASGCSLLELLRGSLNDADAEMLTPVVGARRPWTGELCWSSPGEEQRQVRLSWVPCDQQSGSSIASLVVLEDVTELRRTQLALEEARALASNGHSKRQQLELSYRSLFDHMLDGFALHEIILDEQGSPFDYRFLSVNPAFERLTGLRAERILGRTVLEILPTIERSWIERYGRVALTGEPSHFSDFNQDLGRHFEVTAYRPAEGQFACVFVDATEREEAARAQRESLTLLRNIIDSSADFIYVKDRELRTVVCNQVFASAVGKQPPELYGKTDIENGWDPELVRGSPDKGIRGWEQDDLAAIAGMRVHTPCEPGNVGGEIRYFDTLKLPLRDDSDEIIGMLGISRDVSERVAAEQRSQVLARLLDICPLSVTVHDLDGTFLYANQKAYEIHGYTPEELARLTPDLLHAKESRKVLSEQLPQVESRGQATFEIRRVDRYGAKIPVRVTAASVDWQGQPAILSIAENISERLRMEERLRQMQKLEAIGQLAGGVAHDFNNQLGAILGYAEILEAELVDPELQRYASNIRAASLRSEQLTRQLLAFARKGQVQSQPVDIHRMVSDTVDMLRRTIDRRIRIVSNLGAPRSTILGDASQLQNALLNLGLNARDAISGAGTITFETSVVEIGPEHAEPPGMGIERGAYLLIAVSDTGRGMSDEVKSHLFEPFFTTKPAGKGTGMGLAAVYGTVTQHRGTISVYSEPGEGTSIRLLLPLRDGVAAEESGPHHALTTPPDTQLGVLVADDEQLLRELAARILTAAGHTVLTAIDGRQALELYRQHWQTIDLVILDMVMPELDGPEAFREMRAINPEAKILLASGFSSSGSVQELLEHGASGFIQKPYRTRELLAKVTEAGQAMTGSGTTDAC